MMKNSISLSFFLFTGFMVIGYSVSAVFFHSEFGSYPNSKNLIISGTQNSNLEMNNGQRSILLIGVDSIDLTESKLNSLWMVTYLPSDSVLHVLPIFPVGSKTLSNYEVQLYRSFSLDRINGEIDLGKNFIDTLADQNYWWSGYVVFDNYVMSEILSLVEHGGIRVNSSSINESGNISFNVVDNPHQAFTAQLAIYQTACHRLDDLPENPDWSQVTSLIPAHLLTDFNIQQFLLEWEDTFSGGLTPNCMFPTTHLSNNK